MNQRRMSGGTGSNDRQRAHWRSSVAFIFAAIGSAVGLGNLLRFPYVVYLHGGAAFLLPYALALFGIGLPILQLELAVGQIFQRSGAEAYAGLHPRAWGVGVTASLCAFFIVRYPTFPLPECTGFHLFIDLLMTHTFWFSQVSYYNVVLAWAWQYLFGSFRRSFPWEGKEDSDGVAAETYFEDDVLHIADFDDVPGLGHVYWRPALGLLANWFVWISLCVQPFVQFQYVEEGKCRVHAFLLLVQGGDVLLGVGGGSVDWPDSLCYTAVALLFAHRPLLPVHQLRRRRERHIVLRRQV